MKFLPDKSQSSRLAASIAIRRWVFFRTLALVMLLGAALPLYAQPTIQWDKTLGGNQDDLLIAIQQTRDGGYIMGGISFSPASGDKTQNNKGGYDYWILKLDAAGNKQWDKTIGGADDDGLNVIQQTSDGGYIMGGYSGSPASGDKTEDSKGEGDYWLVKLDAAGNKEWDKTIGGNRHEDLRGLQQTLDGGYIVAGFSLSDISGDKTEASKGSFDYWVVKLDAAGNKVWDKTIGGSGNENLHAVQQLPDGSYILGGMSNSPVSGDKTQVPQGDFDYWLVKLDASGNKVWDKGFGGNKSDRLHSAQQTRDGGFVLGGMSGSGISGDKSQDISCPADPHQEEVWILKLDAAGNKLWDRSYCASIGLDQEETEVLNVVVQTQEGGYLIGRDFVNGATDDFRVIKLDAAGNQEWEKNIGGSLNENLIEYQQTSDGGYILGGRSNSPVSGDKTQASRGGNDYWVVKLAPIPESGQVNSFTLINADTEQPIQLISPGEVLNLATLPTRNLNIRANTTPAAVGSVRFVLSGAASRNKWDNAAPYALYGDDGGNYNKWVAGVGAYTLTATPYAGADAQGQAGTAATISFSIIDQATPGQYSLRVSAIGNGTVSKSPDQDSYDEGSTVELRAIPAAGYVFTGWSGDATGLANPLAVVLGRNKNIAATFSPVSGGGGQQVQSFTLINANNEQPIQVISPGAVLNLATLPTRNLNIRADTDPASVGSVDFALAGAARRNKWDNVAPYALYGDDGGNYNKWVAGVGSYTLRATPYSGADKQGTAGTPLTISFSIVDQAGAASRMAQFAGAEPERQLVLYPNPTADGRIRVQLAGGMQGQLRYRLLSAVGRTLAAGSLDLASTTHLLDFDFSSQLPAAGVYYLRLEGDRGQQVLKMMRE